MEERRKSNRRELSSKLIIKKLISRMYPRQELALPVIRRWKSVLFTKHI